MKQNCFRKKADFNFFNIFKFLFILVLYSVVIFSVCHLDSVPKSSDENKYNTIT
jgi:hypothetical protein